MEKSKLASLLYSLTPAELRKFQKFVDSPIHNKHKNVAELFTLVKDNVTKEKPMPSNEWLHDQLFPTEAYDQYRLNHIKSYLLKVLEEFVAWENFSNQPDAKELLLLKKYSQLGLEKHFKQTIRKSLDKLDKQPNRNDNFLRTRFLFEFENYSFYTQKAGRREDLKVQEVNNFLDQSFIAEKLKIACSLHAHATLAKQEYETGLLDAILLFLKDHDYLKIPAIGIYYQGYRAMVNMDNDEAVDLFTKYLDQHAKQFPLLELRDIFVIGINICIRRINFGKIEFLEKLFALYKKGLELKAFLEGGTLSPYTYKNITFAGLKLNEKEWVLNFIHEYKPFLPEHQREGFYNFNLAYFYYETKRYDLAMPLLALEVYGDVFTRLRAQSLLAKMYYESQELDALSNLLGSLKKYIYRKKDLGYHRDHYMEFIRFLERMMNLKPYDKAARLSLLKELKTAKTVEPDWLIAQLSS